ncbi:MAG: glucosaminidase domain-containing protein [Saprospiraceae bacterium]|nr:glucosaminidase domain-containing protein [Saprospiraceae bacterium]
MAALLFAIVQCSQNKGEVVGKDEVIDKLLNKLQPANGRIDVGTAEQAVNRQDVMTIPKLEEVPSFEVKWTTGIRDEDAISYINRFIKTAQNEHKLYQIPASITMAQALLESNCGKSRLAEKNNNHFGIKCFSKNCEKGHCSNFEDDHHKDFFRIYNSAWKSYREHSIFLNGKRYKDLQQFGNNYKSWAEGLSNAGYATDPNYDKKIIELIERFNLGIYDKSY